MKLKVDYINDWLSHRYGIETDLSNFPRLFFNSLDGNKLVRYDFQTSFGNREINAFVGFIDLKGSTMLSKNKDPIGIYNSIFPFLNKIMDILLDNGALIDKTIGDEVMFIIPIQDETNDNLGFENLKNIFIKLKDFSSFYEYRFRIGLSFGKLYLEKYENDNYKEWMLFGEPIILAKRLMQLKILKDPETALCAISVFNNELIDNNTILDWCTERFFGWNKKTINVNEKILDYEDKDFLIIRP